MPPALPPYLGGALLTLALSAVMLELAGTQRRMVLLAGVVGIAFTPMAVLFNGSYWNTSRLFGWPFGIEDVLYIFATGSSAWFFASWAGGPTRAAAPRPQLSPWRLIVITAGAMLALRLFTLAGLPPALSLYAIPAGLTMLVLSRRSAFRRPALAGALGCVVLSLVVLRWCFWLWPHFRDDWVATSWTGQPLLSIPLGDLVWSAVFGATHPTVLLLALRTAR